MKIFLYILISFNLFFASNNMNGEVLSEEPVFIKVLKSDYPNCQAEIVIDESIDNILKVIEDVNNYKLFFDSIEISVKNDEEQVRLGIDMPFPFTNRDYTVKFTRSVDSNEISYLYRPIVTDNFPLDDNYIRLIEARGGWVLSKIDNKKTLVIYKWNGDMRGDFPNWAYSTAWVKQGNEIMLNLEKEVKRRNNLNDEK